MTPTWNSDDLPPHPPSSKFGVALGIGRGLAVVLLIAVGLCVLLVLRVFEWPVFGVKRPITPHITRFVCRWSLRILGIGYRVSGSPLKGAGAMVANHTSWLDVFALNAATPLYFVAKSEVAGWPGIGWLAHATGTVFVKRDRKEASAQVQVFHDRLLAGHRLLFFPEGTSTDGLQVLPFKSTLFAAFFAPEFETQLSLQAVTVIFHAPEGEDTRFYGWWGDMALATHLWSTLSARKQGSIDVTYHAPVGLAAFQDRKALAKHLEDQVRGALPIRT